MIESYVFSPLCWSTTLEFLRGRPHSYRPPAGKPTIRAEEVKNRRCLSSWLTSAVLRQFEAVEWSSEGFNFVMMGLDGETRSYAFDHISLLDSDVLLT